MTADNAAARAAVREADKIAIRTLRGCPPGTRVRDWDWNNLRRVGPDAWQWEEDPQASNISTEALVRAYGPITLLELPGLPAVAEAASAHEAELREKARRAAHAEWARRFTLGMENHGQAYTEAISDAIVTALLPNLGVREARP